MAQGFNKSRLFFLLTMTILLGCNQKPETPDQLTSTSEQQQITSLDQIYQLASDKNASCLALTDSILQTTSDPNARAEAFYIKGLYFSNIKDIPSAERFLDSTIKENYTFYDAYIEKGIILNEKGEFETALKTLMIAVEITKNNADLYYWIGKSYEGMKKNKEANAYYSMTLQIEPTFQAAAEALKRTKQ